MNNTDIASLKHNVFVSLKPGQKVKVAFIHGFKRGYEVVSVGADVLHVRHVNGSSQLVFTDIPVADMASITIV